MTSYSTTWMILVLCWDYLISWNYHSSVLGTRWGVSHLIRIIRVLILYSIIAIFTLLDIILIIIVLRGFNSLFVLLKILLMMMMMHHKIMIIINWHYIGGWRWMLIWLLLMLLLLLLLLQIMLGIDIWQRSWMRWMMMSSTLLRLFPKMIDSLRIWWIWRHRIMIASIKSLWIARNSRKLRRIILTR